MDMALPLKVTKTKTKTKTKCVKYPTCAIFLKMILAPHAFVLEHRSLEIFAVPPKKLSYFLATLIF